jgi:hypothetical protein
MAHRQSESRRAPANNGGMPLRRRRRCQRSSSACGCHWSCGDRRNRHPQSPSPRPALTVLKDLINRTASCPSCRCPQRRRSTRTGDGPDRPNGREQCLLMVCRKLFHVISQNTVTVDVLSRIGSASCKRSPTAMGVSCPNFLTLKRASTSGSSGQWQDEDYDRAGRRQSGRSHLRRRFGRHASGASMVLVGHRDRAGDAGRDERHCRDAR